MGINQHEPATVSSIVGGFRPQPDLVTPGLAIPVIIYICRSLDYPIFGIPVLGLGRNMSRLAAECRPFANISGGPAIWQSESDEPWIDITPRQSPRNRWVRLTWRCGLFQRMSRPVVRCEPDASSGGGDVDIFLPGTPFGRASSIFHVPSNTKRLLLSPANWTGEVRFQLEQIEILPLPVVFGIAATRSLGGAFHAYGALLIGRRTDMRYILRGALSELPLHAYRTWLQRGTRPHDPVFDGKPPDSAPHLRFLIKTGASAADQVVIGIAALLADLESSRHTGWSVTVLGKATLQASLGEALPDYVRIAAPDADVASLIDDLAPHDLVTSIPIGSRLHGHALDMLVAAAEASPTTSLFYGDNDHLDANKRPCDPIIRPGFDPLLLTHFDYIGPSAIWRVATVRADQNGKCHRGLPDPATAGSGRSLSRFLFRFPATAAEQGSAIRNVAAPTGTASSMPSTAILIPTRDRLDLLEPCIDSILDKTSGDFRIVVLDNDSKEPTTLAYFDKIQNDPRIAVRHIAGPFNFSRICNEGVRGCAESVLVFLNNDMRVIDGDWLEKLTAMATRPDIGAVGAKLLFPDNRVQHAGVIAGLFGRAGHFDLRMGEADGGFFGRANHPHHLLCVTGACLAVERDKFLAVGGFDDRNLPIDLNDIDLCFRLNHRGWNTVQRGDCRLYHLESASRGYTKDSDTLYATEKKYFSATWLSVLRADPYFSPNLTLYSVQGRLG